jgi:N-acetylmuramoyl-L-alanine amidase
MISISIHKVSVHKDKHNPWHMRVMDAGSNNAREIVRSGGETPREAAIWLLRNVNKIAVEVEEQLVELGFLTEAECEAVLAESEAQSAAEPPQEGSPP